MKKSILKLVMGIAFCILCFVGKSDEVKADLIYWPEDEFAEEHDEEIVEHRRDYVVSEQAVGVYNSPKSEEPSDAVVEGELFKVYYLYEDKVSGNQWGCLDRKFWIPMDNMKMVYDNIEFEKEHLKDIRSYNQKLNQYEIKLPLTFYEYPGSDKILDEIGVEGNGEPSIPLDDWLIPEKVYESEDGKLWGYIDTYCWGYRKGWYCLSDFPQNAIRDYNNDGAVDLGDAQTVLKAALKIEDKIKYTMEEKAYAYTLEDAQLVLKAALNIPYDLPVVAVPKYDVTTELDVTGGAIELPVFLGEATEAAVGEVTGEAAELVDIYLDVLNMYEAYTDTEYLAIGDGMTGLTKDVKAVIAKTMEKEKGIEVFWVESMEQLTEYKLAKKNNYGEYSLKGIFVSLGRPELSEDGTEITIMGRDSRWPERWKSILGMVDGQWKIIGNAPDWYYTDPI